MSGKGIFPPTTNKRGAVVSDPRARTEVVCRVCGTPCDSPDCQSSQNPEYFQCPHASEDWHELAWRLWVEIERTPSRRVAELMTMDLADILKENGKA
jgi:hypothetical protein